MRYRLYPQEVGVTVRSLRTRIINLSTALVLVITSLGGAFPLLMNQTAHAVTVSEAVYNALPSVAPDTNYPSVGYQATSTSEFGDYVHLGGSNRKLNTVTVTMSDWAKYATYSSDPAYNSAGWSHPITLNVYSNHLGANGAPDTLLATKTQTFSIPWRPAEDPSCSLTTDNGFGWKVGDTCYNYNGFAFNIGFDFSSANVVLPNDVIVGVAYNTQSYRNALGVSGPYNSLNVAVPDDQTVTTGSDDNTANVFWKTSYAGFYADNGAAGVNVFRQDTNWAPNGTLALRITATPLPTTSACTTTNSVLSTSLSSWNRSETRATGHNELTANGLRVWTEGATSTDKAAGYYTTNFPLSGVGDQTIAQSINYQASIGITPGLQLVVDFNNDGTPDGILVGEATYGNDWWLSTGSAQFVKDNAPNNGGGYGSSWHGTINQWLSKFMVAQVKSIGYSLGSGVHGDGIIKRLTLGCTDYTFGLAAPTNLTPANGSSTGDPAFVDTWSAVEGAAGYEYRTSNVLSGSDLGSIIYSDSTSSQPGRYSTASGTVTRQNGGTPEGTYYWQVRATDSFGNPGPWSVIAGVTVDTSAPTTPTLLTPLNNTFIGTNNFYFIWTASNDISPITYEFQSSQNSHQTGGILDTGVWNNIANGNSEQSHLTTPQIHSVGAPDADWYWQVRAVDSLGHTSAWSPIWKVTIDTHAPAAPVTTSAKPYYTNSTTPTKTLSWTDSSSDIDYYEYAEYYNTSPATDTTPTDWLKQVTGTSTTDTAWGSNVTIFWRVRAIDHAGNTSPWSDIGQIITDVDAPTLTVKPESIGSNGVYQDVSFKLYDANKIDKVAVNGVVKDLTDNQWSDLNNVKPGVFGAVEGTNTVVLYDVAGNTTSLNFVLDTTAPSTPIATPVGSTYSSSQTVALSSDDGTGSGVVAIYYTTDGTTPNKTSTLYAGSFTVSATQTIKAIAYDAVGNASDVLTTNYVISVATNGTTNTLVPTPVTPPTPRTGGSGAGTTGTSEVLGANTAENAASTTPANDSSTGQVEGDSTVNTDTASKDTNKNNAFLGLGWWWLLVLAILSLLWFAFGRRTEQE